MSLAVALGPMSVRLWMRLKTPFLQSVRTRGLAAFPLLRKSRAGEFLAGTFKRAHMMVIKRQDLK